METTKKLSAYQKLKAENLQLKQDIYTLVMLSDSKHIEEAMICFGVRTKWQIRFELENKSRNGSPTLSTIGNGNTK